MLQPDEVDGIEPIDASTRRKTVLRALDFAESKFSFPCVKYSRLLKRSTTRNGARASTPSQAHKERPEKQSRCDSSLSLRDVAPDFFANDTLLRIATTRNGFVKHVVLRTALEDYPTEKDDESRGRFWVFRGLQPPKESTPLTEEFICVISVERIVKGEILTLTNVQRSDMGVYLCIASNGVPPSVSKRFVVQVHCKHRPGRAGFKYETKNNNAEGSAGTATLGRWGGGGSSRVFTVFPKTEAKTLSRPPERNGRCPGSNLRHAPMETYTNIPILFLLFLRFVTSISSISFIL